MVADLTRLHVQTNDVDEFLIGRVKVGQPVMLQVEALDRRELSGRVQTVALQPQSTAAGDLHYPVTIDLGGTPPELAGHERARDLARSSHSAWPSDRKR